MIKPEPFIYYPVTAIDRLQNTSALSIHGPSKIRAPDIAERSLVY